MTVQISPRLTFSLPFTFTSVVEKQIHENATHFQFPYYFDSTFISGEPDTFPIGFPITFLTEEGEELPNHGICFGDIYIAPPSVWSRFKYDLTIFYRDGISNQASNDYVNGPCCGWDVQDYSTIIRTKLKKDDVNSLLDNIVPGAVRELYKILGRPKFVDSTWQGQNTLRLYPVPSAQFLPKSTLSKMRRETIVYPKTITLHSLKGPSDLIECKIEGYMSGNTL